MILSSAGHVAASQEALCRSDLAACLVGGPEAAVPGVWRNVFTTSPYGGIPPLEECLSFDLTFVATEIEAGRLEALDLRTSMRCDFDWSTAPEGAFRFAISRADKTTRLSARLHPDEEFVARYCNGLPTTALVLTHRDVERDRTRSFCYAWDAGG